MSVSQNTVAGSAVNAKMEQSLLEACKALKEYAQIVEGVREYSKVMPIEEAVDRVIQEMPKDGLLSATLIQHKAEIKGMILTEYDKVEIMNDFIEEAREEGIERGKKERRQN